jgi:hypothetical protein
MTDGRKAAQLIEEVITRDTIAGAVDIGNEELKIIRRGPKFCGEAELASVARYKGPAGGVPGGEDAA